MSVPLLVLLPLTLPLSLPLPLSLLLCLVLALPLSPKLLEAAEVSDSYVIIPKVIMMVGMFVQQSNHHHQKHRLDTYYNMQ